METSLPTHFYRYEAVSYAVLDELGDFVSSAFPDPKIELRTYCLQKETPKGFWIGYGYQSGYRSLWKWVSKTSRKRYAYPTKEEALESFLCRTKRKIEILKAQLSFAESAYCRAKDIQKVAEKLIKP